MYRFFVKNIYYNPLPKKRKEIFFFDRRNFLDDVETKKLEILI